MRNRRALLASTKGESTRCAERTEARSHEEALVFVSLHTSLGMVCLRDTNRLYITLCARCSFTSIERGAERADNRFRYGTTFLWCAPTDVQDPFPTLAMNYLMRATLYTGNCLLLACLQHYSLRSGGARVLTDAHSKRARFVFLRFKFPLKHEFFSSFRNCVGAYVHIPHKSTPPARTTPQPG